MKNKFDSGFTAVESILTILIISGVVLIGLYVYKTNEQAPDSASVSSSQNVNPAQTKKAVSVNTTYKSWTEIKPADNSYSIKYPQGWQINKCDQGTILLGPDDLSAGKCNSDAPGQVMIIQTDGDVRDNYELKAQDYPDLNNSEVNVDGVKGYVQTGTYQAVSENFLGPASGTKTKQYIFVKNGNTYVFTYMQTPSFNNAQSYFDQMVTKTLQF